MSLRVQLAIALGIGLFVLAVRAPLLDLPLERDEGGYAYIAWRIAEGEAPYRDSFDQKPPGIVLAYRLALALPGDPVVAIRGLAAVFSALASMALFFLARDLLGVGAGALAALTLGLLSADPMIQGAIANTELFMLPASVAAVALSFRISAAAATPIAASVAVGALLGVASLFKQVALVNVPFLLFYYAWRSQGPGRWQRLARFTGWMFLGGLLVWGAAAGWLLSRGGLGAAVDAIFLHNLEYVGGPSWSDRIQLLIHFAGPLVPSQGAAWALAGVGLGVLALRGDPGSAVFMAGFALVSAIGVSASGRYYPHYFQQLLPAVATLAAAATLGAPGADPSRRRMRAALLGLAALAPVLWSHATFWRLDPVQAIRRIYPDSPFEAMPVVAREVEALSAPDDRVFVFGAEPEILFHAKRASATRYIYLFPLYGDYGDAAKRRQELVEEVRRARPRVIVEVPNAMTAGGSLGRWLHALTAREYRRHALVVWEVQDRGRLIRLPEGADALAGQSPWATIWVRYD